VGDCQPCTRERWGPKSATSGSKANAQKGHGAGLHTQTVLVMLGTQAVVGSAGGIGSPVEISMTRTIGGEIKTKTEMLAWKCVAVDSLGTGPQGWLTLLQAT
jgi:hypothetical protein